MRWRGRPLTGLMRFVPGTRRAIVVVTVVAVAAGPNVPGVAGEGAPSGGLPGLTPLLAPLNPETLQMAWPPAMSVAFRELLDTLRAAKLVDDITDTRSHRTREAWTLGVADGKIGRVTSRISTPAAGMLPLLLHTGLGTALGSSGRQPRGRPCVLRCRPGAPAAGGGCRGPAVPAAPRGARAMHPS